MCLTAFIRAYYMVFLIATFLGTTDHMTAINLTFRTLVFLVSGEVVIPFFFLKNLNEYHNYNNNMRGLKVPQILRNPHNNSITISHPKPNKTLIWLHGVAD